MIKIVFGVCMLLAFNLPSRGQYYYKDIVSNNQLLAEMNLLKEKKIRNVTITSFEDDGRPSEGFIIEKKISRNYTDVETFTRSSGTGASLFTSKFTRDGLLMHTVDSSDLAVNRSIYTYDDNKRIKRIQSHIYSSDDDFTSEITEDHFYEYDAAGKLLRMHRIRGGNDSSIILFSMDEKNNVSIEKDTKTGKTYYYFYDGKNRLTDVVHENPITGKMLPDYLFEYNNAGQVSQMTTTEDGSSYYYIWRYSYADGLRTREKCYSKERKLLGTIEYQYK